MFNSLCPPAFLFLLFGMVHIILAIFNLNYMIGLKYFLLTLLFTTILNYICEKQLSFISWLLILVPFLIMTGTVLKDKLDVMFQERKAKRRKEMDRNSDIILYHDHGQDINNYNHGVGIRKDDTIAGEPIDEKRNYKFDLDSQYNGINPIRFIRDQRLLSY